MNQSKFALQHLSGPRRGREDVFGLDRVAIGRGRNNQLAFDPVLDRTVSARHAEIRLEDGALVLYDLGSLNGTYVNGSKVRRSVLTDGDEIGLGREGPRMRVHLRTGNTPAPIQPGDIPAGLVLVNEGSGGTTRRRPRLSRPVWAAIAVVAIGLLSYGVTMIVRHERRLDDLLAGKEHVPSSGDLTAQAANVGLADPTGALLFRGVQLDPNGRVVGGADLGTGVLLSPSVAVTTAGVVETMQSFLAGHTGGRIVAWADGRNERERRVAGFWPGPRFASGFDGIVALLSLDSAPGPWSTPQVVAPTTQESLKSLAAYRPGIGQQSVWLEQLLSFSATRASGPEQTDILGLRGLPSASSGLPVIDTASSKLVGLSLGPDHPGLAVAARHLFALLEEAKQSSPTPFGK